jgi:uncharacterized repeat protein (TIGR01451 family)
MSARFGSTACALLAAAGVSLTVPALAGSFIFSNDTNPARILHPIGASAAGGELTIGICLDPASPSTGGNPLQALENVVAEYNRLQGLAGNVDDQALGNDFESALLHEVGHCVGMDHSTIGLADSCVGGSPDCGNSSKYFFTIAHPGAGLLFDTGTGPDGQRATFDDQRGNDINRYWFQRGVANPWAAVPTVVDRSTHSVQLGELPGGALFPEVATAYDGCPIPSDNSAFRGQLPTSNTMFPLVCASNLVRRLAPDDVATLRIARSGFDGVQGTADDYAVSLEVVGAGPACDIPVRFRPPGEVGFALCQITAQPQTNDRFVMTAGVILFNDSVDWHFNQIDTTGGPTADLSVQITEAPGAALAPGDAAEFAIEVANAGPVAATELVLLVGPGAGFSFVSASAAGWSCSASGLQRRCTRATLAAGAGSQLGFNYQVSEPFTGADVPVFTASIAAAQVDPQAADNVDTLPFVVVDPARIFRNGFED